MTLLHPRWWLNGGPITSTDWQPSYPDTSETQSKISPSLAPSLGIQLARIRESLDPDEQYRFDRQLEQGTRQIAQFQDKTARDLVRIGEQRLQLQALPISAPDPNPRRQFKKKASHGKASARGLSKGEILERQERERAQVQRQQERLQQTEQ